MKKKCSAFAIKFFIFDFYDIEINRININFTGINMKKYYSYAFYVLAIKFLFIIDLYCQNDNVKKLEFDYHSGKKYDIEDKINESSIDFISVGLGLMNPFIGLSINNNYLINRFYFSGNISINENISKIIKPEYSYITPWVGDRGISYGISLGYVLLNSKIDVNHDKSKYLGYTYDKFNVKIEKYGDVVSSAVVPKLYRIKSSLGLLVSPTFGRKWIDYIESNYIGDRLFNTVSIIEKGNDFYLVTRISLDVVQNVVINWHNAIDNKQTSKEHLKNYGTMELYFLLSSKLNKIAGGFCMEFTKGSGSFITSWRWGMGFLHYLDFPRNGNFKWYRNSPIEYALLFDICATFKFFLNYE